MQTMELNNQINTIQSTVLNSERDCFPFVYFGFVMVGASIKLDWLVIQSPRDN